MSFGIYVHWPFCAAKCPYCDFNSHVRTAIDEDGWVDGILAELDWVAQQVKASTARGGNDFLRRRHAVADAGQVHRPHPGKDRRALADGQRCRDHAGSQSGLAPMPARFADYRAAGINRVSLGVQALNDADLKKLGRLHDVAEAKARAETGDGQFRPRLAGPDLCPARIRAMRPGAAN